MSDADWYALIEGEEYGPLSRAQVLAFLRDGTLAGNDLVWRPGFESWLPLRELQEFWRPPTSPQAYELVRKPAINPNAVSPPPLPEINRDVAAPPPLPDIGDRTRRTNNAMFWYFFQGLIVFAVVASNIHWQWTPNIYLPSLIGIGLAVVFTLTVNELRDWRAKRRARQ